jgi:hypothetical protein
MPQGKVPSPRRNVSILIDYCHFFRRITAITALRMPRNLTLEPKYIEALDATESTTYLIFCYSVVPNRAFNSVDTLRRRRYSPEKLSVPLAISSEDESRSVEIGFIEIMARMLSVLAGVHKDLRLCDLCKELGMARTTL